MSRPGASSPEQIRALGLFSATLLVVGGTIGSGIFFTPAEVARSLPSGALVLLSWALGGAVALAGALTYAELGAMMPAAGGPYVYVREAFGRLPAFLFGWMMLASIASGAIAAVSSGFAGYVAHFVDLSPIGGERPLAVLTIVTVAAVNYLGVEPGATVQNLLTIAKIAALAALIVLGALLLPRLGPPPPAAAPADPITLSAAGFAAAFVPVLFTMGGWQQLNMVAGEIRDPSRLIPRSLSLGIGVVIACYLGANAVYLRALGRDGLAASSAIAAETASRIAGPAGGIVITAGVLLSILGMLHVIVFATPRVVFAMAKDGLFFPAAARVHPRFGSPYVAIAVMSAWAIALLLLTGGRIGTLLGGVVFADQLFLGLGAASVFVLRRRAPDRARPYRVVGYPLVPVFFVLAALVGVASAVVAAPRTSLIGAALLAAGTMVFFARERRARGR
jgi:APA family basic amino acid/polyamine antiporter